MPQLDISTFAPQIFWLIVTFGILYLLMAKLGLPRITGIVEERRRRVESDLEKAANMKAEAEAVIAAYDKALADARHQAQLTMKETADRLAAIAAERQREAGAAIAQRTQAAERRIGEEKAAAMGNLREVAVAAARAAAGRLIGTEIAEGDTAAAVDAVLRGRA